jgi:hypothetical protein
MASKKFIFSKNSVIFLCVSLEYFACWYCLLLFSGLSTKIIVNHLNYVCESEKLLEGCQKKTRRTVKNEIAKDKHKLLQH